MEDLNKLTKAELVARFDGVDGEVLALGQCVAALKPLLRQRYDYGLRKNVVDADAVVRVLEQVATRFNLAVQVDE